MFDIDQCTVNSSRNAGGFTWVYCPIVLDNPTKTGKVRLRRRRAGRAVCLRTGSR